MHETITQVFLGNFRADKEEVDNQSETQQKENMAPEIEGKKGYWKFNSF